MVFSAKKDEIPGVLVGGNKLGSKAEVVASVTVSDAERDKGALSAATFAEVVNLVERHGYVRLQNVFDSKTTDRWSQHYHKRYPEHLNKTGTTNRRPLFTVEAEGPFGESYFYANPFLYPFFQHRLGQDCILGAMSSVVSFPGAPDQRLHRDSEPLFGDDYAFETANPSYAMTVLIPLVDCNLSTGCTRVWPGSHRCSTNEEALESSTAIDPEVTVGSVLITDCKLLHRGAANLSDQVRPLLYLSYHRKWFRDFWGYEDRQPVLISNKNFSRINTEYRHLFAWTKNPYRFLKTKQQLRRFRSLVFGA